MPDFLSFSEIINNNPGLGNVRKIIKQSDVLLFFNDIFPDFKKVAIPVKVEKKTLFLSVENSVMRSELKFKEPLVVSKINSFFKEERIKSIRFV